MTLSETYLRSSAASTATDEGLSEDELERRVPACPEWSVHDLLAHQAGASTDFVRRNLDGVASETWTRRQVDGRRNSSAGELVEEWRANAAGVAPLCDVIPGPNPAWDVSVHLSDLFDALGAGLVPRDTGWPEVLGAASDFLGDRADVTFSTAEHGADPSDTTWHLRTDYGLWRALFSRLDEPDLRSEVLRGDPQQLATLAFFSDVEESS